MPVYVAMIRGINVSGHKIIKMERLRAAFESLGFSGVKTYVQSGNVIFQAAKISPAALAGKITKLILDHFGFSVFVLVRTPLELAEIVENNPLLQQPGIDETKLHVTFLSEPAPQLAETSLKPLAAEAEQFAVRGREIYLYCPAGYGNTKLANQALEKKLSLPATTRNWRTVNTLLAMAQP